MPIYEYECTLCAHRFERVVMRTDETQPACPACGAKKVNRRPSPFRTNAWSRFLDGMEKRVSPEKFK